MVWSEAGQSIGQCLCPSQLSLVHPQPLALWLPQASSMPRLRPLGAVLGVCRQRLRITWPLWTLQTALAPVAHPTGQGPPSPSRSLCGSSHSRPKLESRVGKVRRVTAEAQQSPGRCLWPMSSLSSKLWANATIRRLEWVKGFVTQESPTSPITHKHTPIA